MLRNLIRNSIIKYFSVLVLILAALSVAACQEKRPTVLEQTKHLEKIIEIASKGDSIAEQDFIQISFAEGSKQKFLEKACLELDSGQIFSIAGREAEEQRTSLSQILEANADEGQKLYHSFLENQKKNLGNVQPADKRFSKVYEEDNLAYVFVETPFRFDKLTVSGEELAVCGCTLYRAYMWQKLDGWWQLNQYQERVHLEAEDMALLFPEIPNIEADSKALTEKFLTVFGERAEFE